jgi:hypothetical protein
LSRPFKGHKRERNREERYQKIATAMKGMPERLAKYKQEAIDRKPKKDLNFLFKRIAEKSKDRNKSNAPVASLANSKESKKIKRK